MNRASLLVIYAGVLSLPVIALSGGFSRKEDAVVRESEPVARADLIVPVKGVGRDQLTDTWHQAREDGARVHEAIDIPAAGGTPVLAAQAGTVEKLFVSARGGNTVYIRVPPGDWIHYYAHLASYAPGLRAGQRVAQGEAIGFVGDTGNAGAGNTHLHFAVQHMARGETWYQGMAVNPYPMLAGKAQAR